MEENTKKVAELNDKLRQSANPFIMQKMKDKVVTTQGLMDCFTDEEIVSIFQDISKFDNFTEGDDPYGERDFGSLKRKGRTIFWKIDYYDNEMKYHSPDKADPEQTTRSLTVMLASEY